MTYELDYLKSLFIKELSNRLHILEYLVYKIWSLLNNLIKQFFTISDSFAESIIISQFYLKANDSHEIVKSWREFNKNIPYAI